MTSFAELLFSDSDWNNFEKKQKKFLQLSTSSTDVNYINFKNDVVKQFQKFVRSHEYVVIIKRIKNHRTESVANELYQSFLQCDRENKLIDSQTRKRVRDISRAIKCLFDIILIHNRCHDI